jgi:DNA-binding transcriptional LysR family regulator
MKLFIFVAFQNYFCYLTCVDLELLRTFLEVNRTRHFGEAAEALHLTQAAVSARIKLLEHTLGVRLFDRLRRDIRLTPEGNQLVRHADALIAGWRKARQEVNYGGAKQRLAVGGSLRLWDVLLQDWFHRVRRHLPQLAISAESRSSEILTRHVLNGLLDLAFMLEPAQVETLQIEDVGVIDLVLVGDRAGTIAERALGDQYLMVDWGLAHALEHRRLFPDTPEPRIRVSHAKMALAHILALGGFAYLPVPLVAEHLDKKHLYLVEDAPLMQRHVYAVYPLRGAKSKLIRSCLKLVSEDVPFTLEDTEFN